MIHWPVWSEDESQPLYRAAGPRARHETESCVAVYSECLGTDDNRTEAAVRVDYTDCVFPHFQNPQGTPGHRQVDITLIDCVFHHYHTTHWYT